MGFKMVNKNLVVENARIAFRNFSGKETKYNRAGNRNFCVIFDKEQGEELNDAGWNVRIMQPKDEYDEPAYCLAVSVAFGKIPPKVFMISGNNKTQLDEGTVGTLDFAEIEMVDVMIRPYNWEVNGKTGVKAYVHTLYVTIREDKFASKYDFNDMDEPF